MKQLAIILLMQTAAMGYTSNAQEPSIDTTKLKAIEEELDDVMEVIDTTLLKVKLTETEADFQENPSEINKARLGIIYHETALNLSFLSKTEYKGYAQKSFTILTEVMSSENVTQELLPFVVSYRVSALSLVSAETGKLKLLSQAFDLFSEAIAQYSNVSYLPEFLRGSVSENLPWFFFSKRKFAKTDFQSIIEKQNQDETYANWKIMSFTYWAWANQNKQKKHRKQAIAYLDKAISLDPNYKAGRKRAEELKEELLK